MRLTKQREPVTRKIAVGCYVLIALALLCAAYGILIGSLDSGSSFFVIWFFLAGVFTAIALALRLGWFARLPRWLRRAMLCVVCLCCVLFLIIEGCILSGFGAQGEPDLDYIVVLGAQVRTDGPGAILRRRLNVALAYLQDNPDTLCIVSGGQGVNEPWSEAQGMADYLIQNGIDASRIILEDVSYTTLQNITNSYSLFSQGASVGIVTNNFHVWRALQMAGQSGYTDVCGIAVGLSPLYLPHNMLREALAIVKFILFPN